MPLVRSLVKVSGALRQERWGNDLEGTSSHARNRSNALTTEDLVRRNEARMERFRVLVSKGYTAGNPDA